MSERALRAFKSLEAEDFRTLQGVELGMRSHEYVPADLISRLAGLTSVETDFHLQRLHKAGLIHRWTGPYMGYVLNSAGYDCLALNALVKSNSIEAIGRPLGIGKESDVYDALTPQGERVAVKFHRLGRVSFRKTKRVRSYAEEASWLFQSRRAAEKEYQALKLTHSNGVAVPRPIAQNRHAIVTSLIEGAPLADYTEIPNPGLVLQKVLENVRKAYDAGIIHADLSEFNILIKPDADILIIDWPQFVKKDHPNAQALLERDLRNVLTYFKRKFGTSMSLDEALDLIGVPRRA